ncbi:MAG: hypothetical protein U0V70_01360 [Terriglobia bacterium]
MRGKNRLVAIALAALLVVGFAGKANAQITHLVSSTPVDVIQTGLAEVLGEVRLTKSTIPANTTQTSIAGTINILYLNTPISNLFGATAATGQPAACNITIATGVTINFSTDYCDDGTPSAGLAASAVNTPAGGLVTITIPLGIVLGPDGATITVNGVRGAVTGFAVGADVQASIQSTPSNAHSFINVSVIRVARTNVGLIVSYNGTVQTICNGGDDPTVTLSEGFPGAFVQHVQPSFGVTSANPRTPYGGNADTQFHIQVGGIPANVAIVWPTSVGASTGTGTVWLANTPTISGGVQEALYEFTTSDQAASDTGIETFNITPDVQVSTSSGVGQVVSWAQLYPPPLPTGVQPRFNDPYQPNPPANFVLISKCVTYLLFPFMSNAAGSTFDSGMAIANTTRDDEAFGGVGTGAVPQAGAVTLYGYSQFASGGTAPAAVVQTVASSVNQAIAGQVPCPGLPDLPASKATSSQSPSSNMDMDLLFLSGTYGSSVPVVAEGYLALVIPDPNVAGSRRAAPPNPFRLAGENLGN